MKRVITKTCIHGWIIFNKLAKDKSSPILNDVWEKYQTWKAETEKLNSENAEELNKKVVLLNDYKNYIDLLKDEGTFKLQDKMSSSVLEEFLFHLLKNIPNINSIIENKLIYIGLVKPKHIRTCPFYLQAIS